MRLPDEPEIPVQVNIVPLIDVVFAILTFFIVSTLFLTRSEGLSVNLPSATTAKAQPSTKITVSIKPDGEIALNRKPIQLEALQEAVRSLVEPNSESIVIINADEKVDHGQVVNVMDRVRQIKGAKLAIATTKR